MPTEIPAAKLVQLHEAMLKIRLTEDRLAGAILQGEIRCPVHLYTGQEAVAAGVCTHLQEKDYVFGTHRSHGHYLAKGGDLKSMVAELYGKATGCSGGRGGSMHLTSAKLRIFISPIVGATIAQAVGAALASSLKGDGAISVSFFGDGATEQGRFYESLNLAALYKLPMLFICENNLYSSHLRLEARQPADNIYRRAEMFTLPAFRVDGNDVCEVYRVSGEAIRRARDGQGPTFIECRTYRWRGHVGPHDDLDKAIRDPEELKLWRGRCPVKRMEQTLLAEGIVTKDDLASVTQRLDEEIEEAIRFAKASPTPRADDLLQYVTHDPKGDGARA